LCDDNSLGAYADSLYNGTSGPRSASVVRWRLDDESETRMSTSPTYSIPTSTDGQRTAFERPVDVKTAAGFLGISPSLVYAYVERKQIPHFRMMGRAIRFRLSELEAWRQQFYVNGGIK
jgi:excisionase family DNA binding protein